MPKKPDQRIFLITVSGGVADYQQRNCPDVKVLVLDYDNVESGDRLEQGELDILEAYFPEEFKSYEEEINK